MISYLVRTWHQALSASRVTSITKTGAALNYFAQEFKRKHAWRGTGTDLMPELVEEDDRAIAL